MRIAHWTKAYLALTIAWMHICIKNSVSSPFQHKRTRVIAKKTSLRTPQKSYNIYTKWFWLILAGEVLVRAAWAQIWSIQNILQALYWIWTPGGKVSNIHLKWRPDKSRVETSSSHRLTPELCCFCVCDNLLLNTHILQEKHTQHILGIHFPMPLCYASNSDNRTAPGFCVGHRCRL